ncbi:hypothetical protein GCM10010269_22330 [Streptomyces humidus]|uniref:Uncharacterized protein n=1 Tax=Streptomyces humidus TaxID=52259 RepID=A0A918L2D0_9ACTN|nr:hypothetical protein GCM10010269_22330 [Streptomyces humidus]
MTGGKRAQLLVQAGQDLLPARKENAARAVAATLYVSERTAHRRLRQAPELGLGPADPPMAAAATGKEPAAAAEPPVLPPMLWR